MLEQSLPAYGVVWAELKMPMCVRILAGEYKGFAGTGSVRTRCALLAGMPFSIHSVIEDIEHPYLPAVFAV